MSMSLKQVGFSVIGQFTLVISVMKSQAKVNLYDVTVRSYSQYLSSTIGSLVQAKSQMDSEGRSCDDLVEVSLHPNMLPLHFQIVTIVHFSDTAIEAAKNGVMGGPNMDLRLDFNGLIDYLVDAKSRLDLEDPDEINPLAEGEVLFKYDGVTLPFVTKDCILSYALPSFYFHVTVAYSILRSIGIHIGVANFLGTVVTTPSRKIPRSVHQLTGSEYLELLKPLALPSNR